MKKLDRARLREMWEGLSASDGDGAGLMNETLRAILSRRSVRHFSGEPVLPEVTDAILRAAYHAPSGSNMQTWRFTVLEDPASISRLKQAAAAAESAGERFYGFEEPPCVVIVSNDKRNPTGCQDCACAAENMMVAAASLGLGSVWVNGLMRLRDVEPAKSLLDELGVPPTHVVWAMVALGHPAAGASSPARREGVVRYVDRSQ